MKTKPGKINRNELCYCNSGKKYKKCCINKENNYLNYATSDFTPAFLGTEGKMLTWVRKYDLKALLATLSVIQLQELNHGKDIRVQHIITEAIRANVVLEDTVNYSQLRAELLKTEKHIYEDPPEDFFTDNILFANGNNVVYPGNFVQAQQIVQAQLDALNILRPKYVNEIHPIFEGVFFMLYLHDSIAQAMGHERKMFSESPDDKLYVPSPNDLKNLSSLFIYSRADLEEICRKLALREGTFEQFVFGGQFEKLQFENPDEHPLFHTPFVIVGGEYILAMPSAQLAAINYFIVRKLTNAGLLKEFTQVYAKQSRVESDSLAQRMRWIKLSNVGNIEEFEGDGTVLAMSLHQVDVDKVSLVINFVFPPDSIIDRAKDQVKSNEEYWKKINLIGEGFKKDNPDFRILLVAISNRSNIFGSRVMAMPRENVFDLVIGMSMNEFRVMPIRWNFDALSLWKYTRDREASESAIEFGPYNTHLGIYKFYEDNFHSFFHPNHSPYDFATIGFEVEGAVNRAAKIKLDKIGIEYPAENGLLTLSSVKKEEHLPIYISEEYRRGKIRQCLLGYSCPIWVQSNSLGHPTAEVYVNAILFWLHASKSVLDGFFAHFGDLPIVITLVIDESLYDKNNWEIVDAGKSIMLDYTIRAKARTIELNIPINIISYFAQADNDGEFLLMANIIDRLGLLGEAIGLKNQKVQSEIADSLQKVISPGLRKMILIKEVDFNDPVIADIDVSSPKYISNADISNVLQSQIQLLGFAKPIPNIITGNKEKGDVLNNLVALHFKTVIEMIAEYEAISLLLFLMSRHEDLLQAREMRKISLPTLDACYGEYYDVFAEYGKIESDTVSTSLATRTLIEFVACEMPSGNKRASHESVDIMLAHIIELINYGALSDSIKYEIENPKMGLLPSGRLGIDYGKADRWLYAFRDDLYLEEFNKYKMEFKGHFRRNKKTKKSQKGDSIYYDRVDEIFEKEWGITVWNLIGMCSFLCWQLFERKVSVAMLSEDELRTAFSAKSEAPGREVEAFFNLLTFAERKGVLNLEKNKVHEAFPWRFNRPISYMLKPLIPVTIEGKRNFIISARHIFTAGENILARFLEGTLKVDNSLKGIQRLLAERNDIKGKEFRDSICSWLKTNTHFEVLDFEVKIKRKGFFNATEDKGDVDILCINKSKKIIYSIECKNTSQAKTTYDIYTEIRNYIGVADKKGMIDKHVKRHVWLTENLEEVKKKLDLEGKFKIHSMVLTKHIIPTSYLHKVEIPVYSYSDMLQKKIF
ncbi:SEC-C domain-containing protein [Pedobacter sp. UBA5917]|jgi:hypothetical protein|uniref:SEC-C domain-containing protein n=1 Tax=Pedobacter sp. UBA5917 TaxID=1947061 RepID=UPI0025D56AB1|nr:SEC-C domain-containing protein [Pedobacter sp. UBA5917]